MIINLVEKMIFYPEKHFIIEPEYFNLTYQDIYLTTADDVTIHGWFFPGRSAETLLFFHGNAGNIADRLDNIYRLWKHNLSILIVDYRGYGKSEGSPSEKGSYLDAEAAWQWLQLNPDLNPDKIVIFGRSLGGAIALYLAARYKPYRLILESTFTSVKELGHQLLPLIPKSLIPNIYP
ncbi:alpha/beta hydrolase, partial [candidate division CSSED10-310 bacterium]